ncbi:DUF4440 domain-containing protein [Pseudomonas chlororaphis]|uniref:nuclear transport factor 2 family protein n=1 Tax=Pseudomonas chlororaphis TaxID=587753 RepID=UPI001E60EF2D|nr:DUF4440 domain-containing protein [Pseudomonas chlororaphis]MCB2250868.1 DUF4440 domain-containing protein [Pseudomonas chlororaphis]
MPLHAHLLALETELHGPSARGNRQRLMQLLDETFCEFGASGRVWSRAQVIAALPDEPPAQRSVSDFRLRLLADGVALVTYRCRTVVEGQAPRESLRSSSWRHDGSAWRLVFHQGTPVAGQVGG